MLKKKHCLLSNGIYGGFKTICATDEHLQCDYRIEENRWLDLEVYEKEYDGFDPERNRAVKFKRAIGHPLTNLNNLKKLLSKPLKSKKAANFSAKPAASSHKELSEEERQTILINIQLEKEAEIKKQQDAKKAHEDRLLKNKLERKAKKGKHKGTINRNKDKYNKNKEKIEI